MSFWGSRQESPPVDPMLDPYSASDYYDMRSSHEIEELQRFVNDDDTESEHSERDRRERRKLAKENVNIEKHLFNICGSELKLDKVHPVSVRINNLLGDLTLEKNKDMKVKILVIVRSKNKEIHDPELNEDLNTRNTQSHPGTPAESVRDEDERSDHHDVDASVSEVEEVTETHASTSNVHVTINDEDLNTRNTQSHSGTPAESVRDEDEKSDHHNADTSTSDVEEVVETFTSNNSKPITKNGEKHATNLIEFTEKSTTSVSTLTLLQQYLLHKSTHNKDMKQSAPSQVTTTVPASSEVESQRSAERSCTGRTILTNTMKQAQAPVHNSKNVSDTPNDNWRFDISYIKQKLTSKISSSMLDDVEDKPVIEQDKNTNEIRDSDASEWQNVKNGKRRNINVSSQAASSSDPSGSKMSWAAMATAAANKSTDDIDSRSKISSLARAKKNLTQKIIMHGPWGTNQPWRNEIDGRPPPMYGYTEEEWRVYHAKTDSLKLANYNHKKILTTENTIRKYYDMHEISLNWHKERLAKKL